MCPQITFVLRTHTVRPYNYHFTINFSYFTTTPFRINFTI